MFAAPTALLLSRKNLPKAKENKNTFCCIHYRYNGLDNLIPSIRYAIRAFPSVCYYEYISTILKLQVDLNIQVNSKLNCVGTHQPFLKHPTMFSRFCRKLFSSTGK